MNEITSAITESIRKRSASATLGTYTFFFMSVHWQFIYTSIFVSEKSIYTKYGILKNEYVNKYFIHQSNSIHTIWGYLLPLILTIFFVWVVQKYLLIFAYEEEQKNRTRRRKIKMTQEMEVTIHEKSLTENKAAAVDAKIDLIDKENEALQKDPTIKWKQDYDEFRKNIEYRNFDFIIDSIYSHKGHTERYYTQGTGWTEFEVPKSLLAVADSNNLINVSNENDRIVLTEKGKYFVSRYTSNG